MENTSASAMDGTGSKALEFRRKRLDLASSTHNTNSIARGEKNRSPSSKDHEVSTKISSPKSHPPSPSNLTPHSQALDLGSPAVKEHKIHSKTSSPKSSSISLSKPTPQTPTQSNAPSGFEVHSPKSTHNPSPARKLQQIFHQELLRVEFEERLVQEALPYDPLETQPMDAGPSILRNARGDPYPDGDPNRDYSEEATQPRQPNHSVLNKGKTKNWASIFKSQGLAMDVKLEYFPELHRGKNAEVEIYEDLTEVDSWDKYLVGYFLDGKMPFPLLLSTARNAWKDRLVSLKVDASGFIVFQFRDE